MKQQLETDGRQLNGSSTRETLVAIARDTLDVAGELVRDGVALARLEAENAVRDAAPRFVWGAVAIVCVATASVCAIIAIMIGLGAIIPSVAWRLVILAAVLSLIAFFGSVRAMRSDVPRVALMRKEEPLDEGTPHERVPSRPGGRFTDTILPPPNA